MASKYWFSSRATGRGIRIPISREGKIFTVLYLVIGLVAVVIAVPKSPNPKFSQYIPLVIVAVVLIVTYLAVTIFKAEPPSIKK